MKFKSTKYIGAERRARREKDFLASLTIQADDPDSVIDDNGNVLPVKTIVSEHAENWAESGVKLLNGAIEVFPIDVLNAFKVIAECQAVMKRLSNTNHTR